MAQGKKLFSIDSKGLQNQRTAASGSTKCCPRIAIVGGGMSGLGAARMLVKHGLCDVTVFEATHTLGGRIHTHYITSREDEEDDEDKAHVSKNVPLELGATFIHGTDMNPIYDIAKEYGLLEARPQGENMLIQNRAIHLTTDGQPVPDELTKQVTEWFKQHLDKCDAIFHLEKERKHRAEKAGGENPETQSDSGISDEQQEEDDILIIALEFDDFESFARYRFERFCHGKDEQEVELCEQIFDNLLMWEKVCNGGDPLKHLSLSQVGSYKHLNGENVEIPEGYSELIRNMVDEISSQVKDIQLNTPVKHISLEDDENDENRHVRITLENGQTSCFDHVIVTCSLNFLKAEHESLFQPALPPAKQTALQHLAMGTVDKIFLHFQNLDFFPQHVKEIRIVQPKADNSEVATAADWTSALSCVCRVGANNLLFWLTGLEAEHAELLTDEEIISGCMDVLKRLLNNANIPQPTSVIRSSWHNHPYALGSYTYIPVGGTVEDIDELAKPITDKHGKAAVLFAGEATHPCYYSTTHGAMLSGEREARRIIQLYS